MGPDFIKTVQITDLNFLFKGNDVAIEGVYVMEDGTEMDWVSNLCFMNGPTENALLLSTKYDASAGCWDDIRITSTWRYICEKNAEGGQGGQFTAQAPSQSGQLTPQAPLQVGQGGQLTSPESKILLEGGQGGQLKPQEIKIELLN